MVVSNKAQINRRGSMAAPGASSRVIAGIATPHGKTIATPKPAPDIHQALV
jgi:hypothetical protein